MLTTRFTGVGLCSAIEKIIEAVCYKRKYFSALIRDPARGEKPTVFTCADDKAACSTVIVLAKEIGFEGVDAGHLDASRNIENLGLLVGQLAYGPGFGDRVSLRAYVAS